MADELSDERLEAVLRSIGQHLVIPGQTDDVPADLGRAGLVQRPRRLLVAAAVAAVVVGTTLLVPSARAAVADLLGIGSTRIEIIGEDQTDEASLPHLVEGLAPISAAEATRVLGTNLPDTTGTTLGVADTIHRMPEGGVLLAWRADEATLWLRTTTDPRGIYTKLLDSDQAIEEVEGLGTAALFIDSAHILQTPHRRLATGSVLLWTDDDHEYRLEAAMTRSDMIDFGLALS